MIKGLDISEYQGNVDFNALKGTVDFVIARSSYGVGYIDEKFTINRNALRTLAIPHGFYHYAYPQYNAPQDEADWFVKTVAPQENELLCLDFEESWSGDKVAWCKHFLDEISNKLGGYKPLIYLNLSLVRGNNWSPVIDGNYGLWLAEWDNDPDGAVPIVPWSNIAMRQYADNKQFAGITGNVDADVFYGDVATFQKYGYHSAVTPTPTPTPTPPSGGDTTMNKDQVHTAIAALSPDDQKSLKIPYIYDNESQAIKSQVDDAQKTISGLEDQVKTLTANQVPQYLTDLLAQYKLDLTNQKEVTDFFANTQTGEPVFKTPVAKWLYALAKAVG